MSRTLEQATERQKAATQACWAQWREEFGSPYSQFKDLPDDQKEKWLRITNAGTTRYSNFRR